MNSSPGAVGDLGRAGQERPGAGLAFMQRPEEGEKRARGPGGDVEGRHVPGKGNKYVLRGTWA